MSKKKAPALHERRGREDISTRPPRLAGYPIKLAGDALLRRLSLAADSCVNRKYYGGDPGVGQRQPWLHTIPPSGTLRRRPGARFSLGQVLARTKSTLSALRLVRNCAWSNNLSPAAEGDCVFVLLFARVPLGQGGASSLIFGLLRELLLLRLFLWFWVYLFMLNCFCGRAGYLAFRCYL